MKKYNNLKYSVRSIVLALTFIMVMACSACSTPSAPPAVKIQEQKSANAGDVTISVAVDNFNLNTSDTVQGQGHIIYYLDSSVPTYYKHSGISKAGTFAVTNDTSYTWRGVTQGSHKFAVQLVDHNNSPLPLPVVDSITLTVGAPEGKPALSILNPMTTDALTPGNILLSVSVSGFIISHQDMGVVNREGEGHMIYYIDETPPTDQGVPAKTDTSIVSTDLSHLWKAIKEGQHTLSVQLVNNDDTPLETPIVSTINITVSP